MYCDRVILVEKKANKLKTLSGAFYWNDRQFSPFGDHAVVLLSNLRSINRLGFMVEFLSEKTLNVHLP